MTEYMRLFWLLHTSIDPVMIEGWEGIWDTFTKIFLDIPAPQPLIGLTIISPESNPL